VTEDGNETRVLLLARVTLNPPLGAVLLSTTEQASVPEFVIVALLQVRELSAGVVTVPVPLRFITAVGLVEELLFMVSCPVTDPAFVGWNWTLRAKV
jgi:hypothetical protein